MQTDLRGVLIIGAFTVFVSAPELDARWFRPNLCLDDNEHIPNGKVREDRPAASSVLLLNGR
jgi:hypothetical protein